MIPRSLRERTSKMVAYALTAPLLPLLLILSTHAPSRAQSAPADAQFAAGAVGDFESQTDIGQTLPGSALYDAQRGIYLVTGGGANMWENTDAFHYVWMRARGELILTANVQLVGEGDVAHRKAGWVIRQSLDPDSPYVSAMLHGDGLTSLQYREKKGDITKEVRSKQVHPLALRLQREGDTFTLSAAMEGQPFQTAGSAKVELKDPVYIGLAVCSHDAQELQTAAFSSVNLEGGQFYGGGVSHRMESDLEVISVDGTARRTVYKAAHRFEAPNWSRDGNYLLFNQDGHIYTIPVKGGEPEMLDTGSATQCNNDHGLSPDGKYLAISNSPRGPSLIYVVPATGGEPRQITPQGPSYWHGWSPDGKTLAYCAERNGNFDIYSIPAAGGEETRLTTADGLDDGPDYSPDGKYIYFNSERSGLMQIWRMRPDGSAQEQVTRDDHSNWFAHPSPDGHWLVIITFDKNVKTHPPNKNVLLRLVELRDGQPVGEPRTLVKLFGGQGTINVPSWSPDSKQLAFVSYRLLNP
jgi:TolB protein